MSAEKPASRSVRRTASIQCIRAGLTLASPHHQAARPAVAQEDLVRRDRGPTDRRLPVGLAGGHLDLARDQLDDAVQEVVLVGHVVVERHRLDPELLAELAHAERLDPAFVRERDRGAQHPLPAQRDAGLWARVRFVSPCLTNLRCTFSLHHKLTVYVRGETDVSHGNGAGDHDDAIEETTMKAIVSERYGLRRARAPRGRTSRRSRTIRCWSACTRRRSTRPSGTA